MEMEITFPEGRYMEGRYKDFVVRLGPSEEPWWEGERPAPFDMFIMSIGLCTGSMIWAFLDHRSLPVGEVKIILRRETDEKIHMITEITTVLNMPADFPEKYRNAIARVADACAVKKHMVQAPKFTTEVNIG